MSKCGPWASCSSNIQHQQNNTHTKTILAAYVMLCINVFLYNLDPSEALWNTIHQIGPKIILTRPPVNKTLCPQHMLALNDNLEMIPILKCPNLRKATTPEIFYRICSKVNQVLNSVSPYQLTKFQAASLNNFKDILLTSLKYPNLQRAITPKIINETDTLFAILYQLTKFQAPSSKYFFDKFKIPKFAKVHYSRRCLADKFKMNNLQIAMTLETFHRI